MAVVQDPDPNQAHNSQTQTRKRERSLQMITNEVAFVAIAVSDKERARKFYQETLELTPTRTQMDGAWVEYDIGPITIGVGSHPAWQPSRDGTTVAFEEDDFDNAYGKLKQRGEEFDIEHNETTARWMGR